MRSEYLPVLGISRLRISSDGKGVRTLIGVHGCPLRCKYCLNPKSWNISDSINFYTKKELCEAVKKDDIYFKATGGGITFGGGEPALYSQFISHFVKKYCKSWNAYMETSLNVPIENIICLEEVIDKFVVDIKDLNPQIYKSYTGQDNEQVIENLKYLIERIDPERLIVRVPLIEGYNTKEDVEKTIKSLESMGVKNIDQFAYVTRPCV